MLNPTSYLSWQEKLNKVLIQFLYTTYMVCLLLSHAYHVTSSCDVMLTCDI